MSEYAQVCIAQQTPPLPALERAFARALETRVLDLGALESVPQQHFQLFLAALPGLAGLRAARLGEKLALQTKEFFQLTDALRLMGVYLDELEVNCERIGAPAAVLFVEMLENGLESLALKRFQHLQHFLCALSAKTDQLVLKTLRLQECVSDENIDGLVNLLRRTDLSVLDLSGGKLGRQTSAAPQFAKMLGYVKARTELDLTGCQLTQLHTALLAALAETSFGAVVRVGAQAFTGNAQYKSQAGQQAAERQQKGAADDDFDIMNRVLTVADLG